PVCALRRTPAADSSLWPWSSACPEGIAGRPLAAIVPDGVRTFLDAFRHRDRPICPAPALYRLAVPDEPSRHPSRRVTPPPGTPRPKLRQYPFGSGAPCAPAAALPLPASCPTPCLPSPRPSSPTATTPCSTTPT